MPTYEFRCQACGDMIERTMHVEEHDEAMEHGIECPRCHSKDVTPQVSTFEVKTSRKAS